MAKYDLLGIPDSLIFSVTSASSGYVYKKQLGGTVTMVCKVVCFGDCTAVPHAGIQRPLENYSFITDLESIQELIAIHPYGAIMVMYDAGASTFKCDITVKYNDTMYVAKGVDMVALAGGLNVTFNKVS